MDLHVATLHSQPQMVQMVQMVDEDDRSKAVRP